MASDTRLGIRLEDAQVEELRLLASAHGTSQSEMIRMLIDDEFLKHYDECITEIDNLIMDHELVVSRLGQLRASLLKRSEGK